MNRRLYFILALIFILVIFACNINNPSTPQAIALIPALTLSVQAQNAIDSSNTAGQVINYQYAVTNTGNVPLAGPVTVTDDKIMVTCPDVTTVGNLNTNLDPNETLNCTGMYTISQADLGAGAVTNNATASAAGTSSTPATSTVSTANNIALQTNPTPAAPTPSTSFVAGSTIHHRVEKGDWLIQIARCYGADYNATRRANPQILNPSVISINNIVTVPNIGSNGNMYGPPCVKYHTVQTGDTWTSIAQLYNADVVILQAANRGVSLTAGRVVKVPVNSAGGSPQPPPPGYKTLTINVTGSGTVTSSQLGINCGSTCRFNIAENSSVTLTASATSTSAFSNWGGACASFGTSPSCNFTMNTDQTVTATFTSQVTNKNLNVNITGNGSVTSTDNRINCNPDCTESYQPGTQVTLKANTVAPATFSGWGGDCTSAGTGDCILTMDADHNVTANFASPAATEKLTLTIAGAGTVTSPPPGINCSSNSTCSFDFPANTSVTLTASPIAPSTFAGWSGAACSGPTLVCIVSMTGDQNITATFNPPSSQTVPTTTSIIISPSTLTLGQSVSFSGQVSPNTAGGPPVPDGQEVRLQTGGCHSSTFTDQVTVSTTGNNGSFSGSFTPASTGNFGLSVSFPQVSNNSNTWQASVSECKVITVNPATLALTVDKDGTGDGTVTSNPSGINCGSVCSAQFDFNATVALTANPDSSSDFGGWNGGGCSGTDTCQVPMSQIQSVTATFNTLENSAPLQISPANGTVFNNSPRTTTLKWSAVPGAVKYRLERVWLESAGESCSQGHSSQFPYGVMDVNDTTVTFDFIGAQTGCWRVWAVDAAGQDGPKSDWWTFKYTQ